MFDWCVFVLDNRQATRIFPRSRTGKWRQKAMFPIDSSQSRHNLKARGSCAARQLEFKDRPSCGVS